MEGIGRVLVMMFVPSHAMAQNNPLPWDDLTEPAAYVTFNVVDSEWTLYPVITANSDFIGFFGYLPDEFVVGNNVSLLWLIPDNGDGTWSMYGWSNTDLKVVSDYLDNLTGTLNVLSDTGLDIFSGESQPIVDPKSMPFGIAVDDPLAPIMEATQDPAIASALIAAGAAGAPNLTQATNMQPIDGDACITYDPNGSLSQLDMDLAYQARIVQETMVVWLSNGIVDSLQLTGWDIAEDELRSCGGDCTPFKYIRWDPWSDWDCGAGPFDTSDFQCIYQDCDRSRTGRHTEMTRGCVFTTTTVTDPQHNNEMSADRVDGVCPDHP